jgi:hypothetical protein
VPVQVVRNNFPEEKSYNPNEKDRADGVDNDGEWISWFGWQGTLQSIGHSDLNALVVFVVSEDEG